MQEWYSVSEIASIYGVSAQAIQKKSKVQAWQPRRERKGRGGGWEYHIKSLPKSVQSVLTFDHYSEEGLAQQTAIYIEAQSQPRAIAPPPTKPELPEIQALPEYGVEAKPVGDKKQQERDAKLSILTMLEDFCAKHAIGICKAREENARAVQPKGDRSSGLDKTAHIKYIGADLAPVAESVTGIG